MWGAGVLLALLVLPFLLEIVGVWSPTPSDQTVLQRVALTASQVGPGYRAGLQSNGVSLTVPTLNLCGKSFASERLRSARLQMSYVNGPIQRLRNGWRPANRTPVISNEVVKYGTGGAQLAVHELKSLLADCPASPHLLADGPTGLGRFSESLTPLVVPGTLPSTVAFADHIAGAGEFATVNYYVFQFDGDFMSGLYVSPIGRRAAALHALLAEAPKVAANLSRSVTPAQ